MNTLPIEDRIERQRRRRIAFAGAGIFLFAGTAWAWVLEAWALLFVFYWPVLLMLKLLPAPCFDRGPGQRPFCEGTPVQVLAAGIGIVLSPLFWYLLIYLVLYWLDRRRARLLAEQTPPPGEA